MDRPMFDRIFREYYATPELRKAVEDGQKFLDEHGGLDGLFVQITHAAEVRRQVSADDTTSTPHRGTSTTT